MAVWMGSIMDRSDILAEASRTTLTPAQVVEIIRRELVQWRAEA